MRLIILFILLLSSVGTSVYYLRPQWVSQWSGGQHGHMIVDGIDLFNQDEKLYLQSYHQMLLDRFDLDYRIVTTRDQSNINTFTNKMFKDLDVGQHSSHHRGLLLVIDPHRDQVRLEVSANLESIFTDAFVSYLEHRQMVPFFKENRIADGISATSEIIRIRAMDAQKGKQFDLAKIMGSIGGGARTKANIGAGKEMDFKTGKPDVKAANEPQETLRRYIKALANRNGRRANAY